MIRVGEPPYLECSTRGERRLSPFCAYPSYLLGVSIEEAYHAMKVFEDGSSNLSWRRAKQKKDEGVRVTNQQECNETYSIMWDEYMREHPELVDLIRVQTGLSDIFGQEPGPCQALELWRIRNDPGFRGEQSSGLDGVGEPT